MLKRLISLLLLFVILIIANFFLINTTSVVSARENSVEKLLAEINSFELPSHSLTDQQITQDVSLGDSRVANLKAFFRKHSSPLYDYAFKIVEEADKYQFDYRLLPAIAMQESNVCKVIPDDSYNCWGWGIYGSTITRFESYDDAIETVSEGIKTHYIDKGLVTASQIMKKYTPSSNGSWAHGVNTFLKALE